MRHHNTDSDATRLVSPDLHGRFDVARARVDDAYRRVFAIEAGRHAPAAARAASYELSAALREATATAVLALQLLDIHAASTQRRLRPRRKANRSAPPAVTAWSAELVRLSQIDVWLCRATLDDPGVHVATTVRVANYAAKGPRIAGVDFGNQAPVDGRGPRIGIDLQAVMDGISAPPAPGTANPVTEYATTVPKAA